jgi:hypothetical protein
MYPVSSCHLSCSVRIFYFLGPDYTSDEAVRGVLRPCPWYLVLEDKEDRVRSLYSAGHSLRKPSKFVAIRMSPCGLCLGIGNQVLAFERFTLFTKDRIGRFAETYQREYLGGQFGC